jgi:type VI secretion system protein ImpI
MSVGVRLRFRSRDGTVQGEETVNDLPVRVGRNAMNDCRVRHPFVSEFHAVIDLVGGQLCVTDLNSRNGVQDSKMSRLPTGEATALAPLRNAFVLGRMVDVAVEAFEPDQYLSQRPSAVEGSIIGNRAAIAMPSPLGGSMGVASLPPLSGAGAPFIGAPSAWGGPPAFAPPAGGAAPPLGSLPPPYDPARSPGMGNSLPDLPPLPGNFGPRGGYAPQPSAYPTPGYAAHGANPQEAHLRTQHLSMSTELMALLGLQELGGSLVPGVPLKTTGEIARLLTKLHDLIEVFCRCFVTLREGSAPLLSTGNEGRAVRHPSASAQRVAKARDPASLAAALLDWRNQDLDAPKAAEDALVDIVSRYALMTDALLQGIDTLIEELSPEAIEQGTGKGLFGSDRARWQAYKARHKAVAEGALDRIFGHEVAASYRAYVRARRTVP